MATTNNKNTNNTSLLLIYAYLLLYISLSSGQIFFNKFVLSSRHFNFPFPVSLTLLHMLFSSLLCFLTVKVFKLVKLQDGMTFEMYITSVCPIGAMFAMTLWLGNSAYLYISVAFAQMLKALMPVAVFLFGASVGLEALNLRMMSVMCLISFGVIVASYGEINFSLVGAVYQLGGVLGEASRLILMELLIKRKGIKLDPITMMYYMSPCSAFFLSIPWLFMEKPKMDANSEWKFDPFIMSLNALCTFALNVSVFLVISNTSALTIRVAGVVRDWIVVLLSMLIFLDSKLTYTNTLGYFVAMIGVVLYNNYKLREAAQVSTSSPATSINGESLALPISEKL